MSLWATCLCVHVPLTVEFAPILADLGWKQLVLQTPWVRLSAEWVLNSSESHQLRFDHKSNMKKRKSLQSESRGGSWTSGNNKSQSRLWSGAPKQPAVFPVIFRFMFKTVRTINELLSVFPRCQKVRLNYKCDGSRIWHNRVCVRPQWWAWAKPKGFSPNGEPCGQPHGGEPGPCAEQGLGERTSQLPSAGALTLGLWTRTHRQRGRKMASVETWRRRSISVRGRMNVNMWMSP